jgi:hypothetical protein
MRRNDDKKGIDSQSCDTCGEGDMSMRDQYHMFQQQHSG